jgi:hypothetical protein
VRIWDSVGSWPVTLVIATAIGDVCHTGTA